MSDDPILKKKEIDLLFKHIPVLFKTSDALLADLEKAKFTNIGRVFIKFAPYMRAYSQYLNSYITGINALQIVRQDRIRKSKWLDFLVGAIHYFRLLAERAPTNLLTPSSNIPSELTGGDI